MLNVSIISYHYTEIVIGTGKIGLSKELYRQRTFSSDGRFLPFFFFLRTFFESKNKIRNFERKTLLKTMENFHLKLGD